MRANCWYGKNDVRVERVPDPEILNPRDAIVRITSTAICGSDLHLYNGFIPTMEHGDIIGHEFMGEVVGLGPGNRLADRGRVEPVDHHRRRAQAADRLRCSRVLDRARDLMTSGNELRHQPPTNGATCAGNKDPHRWASFLVSAHETRWAARA